MRKKKLLRSIEAMLLAAAITFTGALTSIPAYAAEIPDDDAEDAVLNTEVELTSGKALRYGTSGMKAGQHIIFGKTLPASQKAIYYCNALNGRIPYWRVLDANHANDASSPGVFVVSEYLWAGTGGAGIKFNNSLTPNSGQNHANEWQGSDVQKWCSDFYDNRFTDIEKKAVLGVDKHDADDIAEGLYQRRWEYGRLDKTKDKVFFLSSREVYDFIDKAK